MGNFLHAVLPIACRTRSTYTDRQNRMNQYKKVTKSRTRHHQV